MMQIMGILNVTPDSFSDGGSCTAPSVLKGRIEQLLTEGADIIDVGGESTRPYAQPVGADEELARVLPAIRMIREQSSAIPISIDTTKAQVAREALLAGATMVNDISALRCDQEMIEVARTFSGKLIIMHMQGTPGDMQNQPQYENVIAEINVFFRERIVWLQEQGIPIDRIVIDPGIGFGKSLEHNLAILRDVEAFKVHGCPILIGHSRKSFLGQLLDIDVLERDCPTALVSAFCAQRNVDYVRVHNVGATQRAVRLAAALSCK